MMILAFVVASATADQFSSIMRFLIVIQFDQEKSFHWFESVFIQRELSSDSYLDEIKSTGFSNLSDSSESVLTIVGSTKSGVALKEELSVVCASPINALTNTFCGGWKIMYVTAAVIAIADVVVRRATLLRMLLLARTAEIDRMIKVITILVG